MKPLMLAHVVLQSDYCMGHESNRVEISSDVGIPTLALGRVYTGLPVTRRKHSGRYSDRHRKKRPGFLCVRLQTRRCFHERRTRNIFGGLDNKRKEPL
jgi:hypothetical protein